MADLLSIRDAALGVECPLCYAEPGDTCLTEDGSEIVPVHDERIAELRENVARGHAFYESKDMRP